MRKIETIAPNPGTTKENTRELTAHELDAVSGGRLAQAVAKGTHFKTAVLTVR